LTSIALEQDMALDRSGRLDTLLDQLNAFLEALKETRPEQAPLCFVSRAPEQAFQIVNLCVQVRKMPVDVIHRRSSPSFMVGLP
jgi:phosphatidate phosphatase APP1